ncbi:MAG: hypothetical protein HY707_00835 [Ignavibacteriae bacterium]|nr:hypothetical protein [Ignavibacteriota bacterium]
MDQHKGLRTVAYVCQKLAVLGGVFWGLNAIFFFYQYFSDGMKMPDFRSLIASYGGTLIAAIVPVLLLYAAGGVINLLLNIEANTRRAG